jgi:hypothetical protein
MVRSGICFYMRPKRIKNCELHKNPETRKCGPSVMSLCRTGVCTDKTAAQIQWTAMNPRTANEQPGAQSGSAGGAK